MDRLDEDEKPCSPIMSADGRFRPTWCVNEWGFYTLALWSTKPEAEAFQEWVTHDVRPMIRRTGTYQPPSEQDVVKHFLSPVFHTYPHTSDAVPAAQTPDARTPATPRPGVRQRVRYGRIIATYTLLRDM